MNTTIKYIHDDNNGTETNKLAFNHPHVTIIGTNNRGKKILEAF